jgi:DNA-directed RNA polymerase specialized sigma24 family protein
VARELNQAEYHLAMEKLFDGDPAKYLKVWDALVLFFERQRVDDTDGAEQLADEAMHRLFVKAIEGLEVENVKAYGLGVARLVFRECHRKRQRRQFIPLEEVVEIADPLAWLRPPQQAALEEMEDARFTRAAQDIVLNELERLDHELLARYYETDQSGRQAWGNRVELAQRRNMTLNHLSVKVHRLRSSLRRAYESELRKLRSQGTSLMNSRNRRTPQ